MNKNSVKESVVASYGKLAKSRITSPFNSLFACCDNSGVTKSIATKIGYSDEDISAAPADSNLGVGCGNPSAFAIIREGQTVVDLGSGAGFDAFVVAKEVGVTGKVIGVDLSDEMISLAQKNAEKGNYKNVSFRKGDIEDVPLQDNIADHVISNCVINLSLNKAKVYQEAFRVMKEGGTLSISDIALEKDLPASLKSNLAAHIACISGAERVDQYMNYIKDAGFKDVEVISKAAFPLDLVLTDPQVIKIAKETNFDLHGEEVAEVASRVVSITITARK